MAEPARLSEVHRECTCHMHNLGFVCDACGPLEECGFDHPDQAILEKNRADILAKLNEKSS